MSQDDGLDGLRKLAEAGVQVLGTDNSILQHHCRPGSWFFIGGVTALACTELIGIGWGWTLVGVLAGGYVLNEHERRNIKRRLRQAEEQGVID